MPTRLLLEGADIQQLLAQVRAEHGPGARIVSAERGPAGPTSTERFVLTVEIDDDPTAAEPGVDSDALLALADAQEDRLGPEPPAEAFPEPPAEAFTGASFAEVLTALAAEQAAAAEAAEPAPAPAQFTPASPTTQVEPGNIRAFRPPVAAAEEDLELRGSLLGLGLPRWLAQRVSGSNAYPAILHALSALPPVPTPPAGAGDVLVVFGGVGGALAVAEAVSRALRLNPDDIVVARSWTPLPPRTDRPQVIVVDAADGTDVEALRPTAIWAVVDATRKTVDTARQLRELPRVDALAVRGASATADPASILQLDIPVAMLDERAATAHEWTALLCRQLVEESP